MTTVPLERTDLRLKSQKVQGHRTCLHIPDLAIQHFAWLIHCNLAMHMQSARWMLAMWDTCEVGKASGTVKQISSVRPGLGCGRRESVFSSARSRVEVTHRARETTDSWSSNPSRPVSIRGAAEIELSSARGEIKAGLLDAFICPMDPPGWRVVQKIDDLFSLPPAPNK